MSAISVSSTLKVSSDADKLRQQGIDVVDFGAGEPDFPTPENIKQAAYRAIQTNFTKYTAAGGTLETKQAVCDRHAADFGTSFKPSECVISVGGKHVIFNIMQVLVNPGDEVIIPVPYWVTYKDVVNYAGGKCVFLETDEAAGFALTAAMVERAITPRTKIIIINSPSNPNGAVIPSGRVRKDLSRHLGRRRLSPHRRVLLPFPLRQRALFHRLSPRSQRARAGRRYLFQNLRHDRVAHWLRLGPGKCRRRHA